MCPFPSYGIDYITYIYIQNILIYEKYKYA